MNNNKFIDVIDKHFNSIANWSINNRNIVVLLSLLMLGIGSFAMTKVRFDGSIEGFFNKSDTTYNLYKEYLDEFLSDEITYILYRVPKSQHGPFDLEAMRTISKLTQTLEDEVPFVREATSLSNVEYMFSEDDTIIIDELMINFPNTQEKLLSIKQQLMSKPLYIDYLINQEGNYAAIYLEMSKASPDPLEEIIFDPKKGEALDNIYPQVSDYKVREILKRPEFAQSGIEFYLTGDVPMNSAYNNLYMYDSAMISLYTLILIAIISFLLLKTSLIGLLGPLLVVILSVVMMMGVIGLAGWSVGLFIAMAPSLICAIGVAQAVHIILEYHRSMAQQGHKSTAVKQAIKKVGGPCLLAALTTAAGFLVMSTSQLQGLADFGIYAAVGVLFTFILSMTLLVIFLAGNKSNASVLSKNITETEAEHGLAGINPIVSRIVEQAISLNHNYPKIILLSSFFIVIWACIGISKLNIDFNFLEEFKPHVEWRQHTELADKVMGGVNSVSYIIDSHKENGVKNVQLLQAIDKLQHYAEQKPLVKKTFSIADYVKDLNYTFNDNDPEKYQIPNDQALTSQLLLVYEMSGGKELEEVVSPDFSRTVLELRIAMSNASEMRKILTEIDTYIEKNPLPGADIQTTGIGLLWVKIADYITETQIVSYSLVFIMISLVMCAAYGSVKLGLLCMVPNITPILITLGAMGWMGITLDYMKLLLATIAIGIAIDDTIHLVTRFRSRFYQSGNYSQALTASLRDVGPALVITTLILVGGFAGYLFTDLAILSSFGILLGITISTALVADLLLMPVLLVTLKPLGKEFTP